MEFYSRRVRLTLSYGPQGSGRRFGIGDSCPVVPRHPPPITHHLPLPCSLPPDTCYAQPSSDSRFSVRRQERKSVRLWTRKEEAGEIEEGVSSERRPSHLQSRPCVNYSLQNRIYKMERRPSLACSLTLRSSPLSSTMSTGAAARRFCKQTRALSRCFSSTYKAPSLSSACSSGQLGR
jgi:hypothetical protein